jgi:predicted glycoside hydrolase/deacetylase ChbG (UPF0249 family)
MKETGVIIIILSLLFTGTIRAQKTIQERLGYSKDTKLVILHADDIGVSHSENEATIVAMEKGMVNSGSIMVPCPWFPEIAAYASTHPDADFGLHLTLTSEWKFLKWGPTLPRDQVPGLVNERGYMYGSVEDVGKHASVEEVEKELRSQIERAKQFGINPTHFDTHMGSVMARPEFIQVYLKLGKEYKVPVLINGDVLNMDAAIKSMSSYASGSDIVVDKVWMATNEDFQGGENGMAKYYTKVLKTLQPGLNCILLHAAYDNEEMKAVAQRSGGFGSTWRQADFNFFTSAECKRLIAAEHIQLITWREVGKKLIDGNR